MWLCLQSILRSINTSSDLNTSSSGGSGLNTLVKGVLQSNQPYYPHQLFEGLQFSSSHLTSAVPDSLCHMDLLAFLAATVYCQLDNGAGGMDTGAGVLYGCIPSARMQDTSAGGQDTSAGRLDASTGGLDTSTGVLYGCIPSALVRECWILVRECCMLWMLTAGGLDG